MGVIGGDLELQPGVEGREEAEKVIEVDELTIERSHAIVVENASFDIHKGDYIGMVGPNGGGKTTLLKAMLGIIPFKSGRVKLYNQDIGQFRGWDRIAYLSQNAINFDEQFPLSVRELVSLGRISRGKIARRMNSQDREIVDRTMEFLGISHLSGKRIGQLSGGQKQRIVLAKALVREPSLVILDEPVSGVDADTQEKFYKMLSDLNLERGITILMVSHDLAAVFCRMSHIMCVNRYVRTSAITSDLDPNPMLKETYGDHFQFAYHLHDCRGLFKNG
jgi:zinc transport system ATP-binding protein